MSEFTTTEPQLNVACSPHVCNQSITTRRMMTDVILALLPAIGVSIWVFGWNSIWQMGLSVFSCLFFEFIFTKMCGKKSHLEDCSAIVTGLIIALSLPWSTPFYVPVIASMIAMGLGKVVYGGLGCNIFNPAMVGRAFVMLSFSSVMAAGAYVGTDQGLADYLTQATPMTQLADPNFAMDFTSLICYDSFFGKINGSLGETSALALIIGGIFLCLRRTTTWDVPFSSILTVFVCSALFNYGEHAFQFGVANILNGAILFGAFFIATDPVTNPMTTKGRIIFGCGFGFLTVVLRQFSSYPEGVMFAVLLMNSLVPMINRITIPRPFGQSK